MRKVVDSNLLRSEKLRTYFAKSPQNYAVLTDYASMEAYKGDALANVYRSMEILAEYPRQVIILKTTNVVCALKGHSSQLQRRLIDDVQTRRFWKYCKYLKAAMYGDSSIVQQILELGRQATAQMDRLLFVAEDLPHIYDELAEEFTEAELVVIRTSAPYTEPVIKRLIENVLQTAAMIFRNHPEVTRPPRSADLPNTYIFRFSLCAYLLFLWWTAVGGARNVDPKRIRNDMVDLTFAAYGTFFDGLLTEDKKLMEIYSKAYVLLHSIFLPSK